MRSSFGRYGAWFLAGIGLAVVLVLLVVGYATSTAGGHARVLRFTLTALGGRLNGTLTVERLAGNILTGARLYEISLRDAGGSPMVQADSAYLEYDLPTFLGGDVVINRLVLYDPEVHLVRLPGDSLWNYQRVLQDTTRPPGGEPGRATLIDAIRLVDARVTVRLPWEPDPSLGAAARRREVREALADTSRVVVDSVAGGYLRTLRFAFEEATAGGLIIAPDERGGTSLRIESAAGEAFLYRDPPLRFRQVVGELGLREGILRYLAPTVVLPESRLTSAGVVDLTGGDPAYDIEVTAERVALADLRWLYPRFPEEGGGEGRLWVKTRPDGLLLLTRDLLVSTPGTRVRGDFGMILGDTLRFVDADLTADPLDVATVERLLPAGLPVRGLRIGGVVIGEGAS